MLELKSKFLTGRVLPEVGGCLERLDLTLLDQTIRPVLVAPSTAATHAGDARQSAHFAMLPYVNRVRGNMLRCGDAVITMQPNTDEPLALHGAGWQGAWRVLSATADRCELGLDAPANYPFRFHARQTFTLSDDALLINLSVTNTSSHAIPVGLGFHPYFPRDVGTRLQFDAEWFWLEGSSHLPTDSIRVPPELSFAHSRHLPGKWRANCYTGWHGKAVIEQPVLGYSLFMTASENCSDLMFYTPPDAGFFALEPQSHTSGFVQTYRDESMATPMRELSSGETLACWMQVQVLPHTIEKGKK